MTIKPIASIDREIAIYHFRGLLQSLGYAWRGEPGMNAVASGKDTAERAVDAYLEFFAQHQDYVNFTTFPADGTTGMIAVTQIEFASMCVHHFLPYVGVAHVCYIPGKLICGLSKIVRVVMHYAHRPSVQEDLTSKIATFMWEQLKPKGVGVMIEAQHACIAIRGVCKPRHWTITCDTRGCFEESTVKNEFLSLIRGARGTQGA